MNVYANIFLEISNHLQDNELYNDATYFFKKAIEYNTKNISLSQEEIDILFDKYKNKSIGINKALLYANNELLEDMDSTEALLFLSKKYFYLDGLGSLFIKSVAKFPKNCKIPFQLTKSTSKWIGCS